MFPLKRRTRCQENEYTRLLGDVGDNHCRHLSFDARMTRAGHTRRAGRVEGREYGGSNYAPNSGLVRPWPCYPKRTLQTERLINRTN